MRNTITRTITTTTIHPAKIAFENGAPVVQALEPITVHGIVTDKEAQKIAFKAYGKGDNIVVANLETNEKFYEISVADFIKYAKEVEKPTASEN